MARGVTEEVDYMKLVAHELQRISKILASDHGGGSANVTVGLQDELNFARQVLQVLAGDAMTLVQLSHAASLTSHRSRTSQMLLAVNSSQANAEELASIRDRQNKEENRLGKEVELRLRSIRVEEQQAIGQVDDVLKRLNSRDGAAAPEVIPNPDPVA